MIEGKPGRTSHDYHTCFFIIIHAHMSLLAVIPARGGSKGVPQKNITKLNGKPLITHTIDAAVESNICSDIIVSTEDAEIADIARDSGIEVPFLRPPELATDEAPTYPVVLHVLKTMESQFDKTYDYVLLLQPTCPFRKSHHILAAAELMRRQPCDSVVSVVELQDKHPFRMKRLIGNRLINYIDQGFEDMRPRQSLPKVYVRNGAIYLTTVPSLINDASLVGNNCLGMVMSEEESINIDTKLDFLVASAIMEDT